MQIGELAHRAGVNPKTIRFYEDQGLLPAPARTPNHYRDYDDTALGRLGFIRAAQTAGFTLREITGVLDIRDDGGPPCHHVRALIDQRLGEIDDRIAELERTRHELQTLAARAQTIRPDDCPPSAICRIIKTDTHA
jgi:DNA-binding transcriptional MerR regulator